jgi:hypothetical protein
MDLPKQQQQQNVVKPVRETATRKMGKICVELAAIMFAAAVRAVVFRIALKTARMKLIVAIVTAIIVAQILAAVVLVSRQAIVLLDIIVRQTILVIPYKNP